jgi:hypothetical protein
LLCSLEDLHLNIGPVTGYSTLIMILLRFSTQLKLCYIIRMTALLHVLAKFSFTPEGLG